MKDSQVDKYLRDPTKCPHCGSEDISGDTLEPLDADAVKRDIFCESCAGEWTEIFYLGQVTDKE